MGNAPRKNKRCGYCKTAQKHCKCMPVKAIEIPYTFSPGGPIPVPIMPVRVDPKMQTPKMRPRVWDYPCTWNLPKEK